MKKDYKNVDLGAVGHSHQFIWNLYYGFLHGKGSAFRNQGKCGFHTLWSMGIHRLDLRICNYWLWNRIGIPKAH